nr:M3 family metallopeptidase [Pelagicoccus albus]
MENCSVEATRRKMKETRYSLAREENAGLLQDIVELRAAIAEKLGYETWADYRIEPKMAKDAETALAFEREFVEGLEPKFKSELAAFRELKVEETGDPNAEIKMWDWRYYANQLKKRRYSVDTEALRVFFPYEQTLRGMFSTYERTFGLKIEEVEAPYRWVDDLTLHMVSDAETGEPLGLVYLDMFPREGKYNHFAQFAFIRGKQDPGGQYRRPTVALLCNFPKALGEEPALLSHSEVETLFHEFGHALHSIMTRAKYQRFSGTSVPRDFVEVPSQLLERWTWSKPVLDTFARDYRDTSKTIPAEVLERMKQAQLATVATHYRRQLGLGMLDLTLHTQVKEGSGKDVIELSNQVFSKVFLPVPADTSFATFFGHLTGYDAGYYGYAWADAIASDLSTVFEESEKGYFDEEAGKRLREEIYAPGGSREIETSIKRFLGRSRSIEPFLQELGIESGNS